MWYPVEYHISINGIMARCGILAAIASAGGFNVGLRRFLVEY